MLVLYAGYFYLDSGKRLYLVKIKLILQISSFQAMSKISMILNLLGKSLIRKGVKDIGNAT